MVHKFNLVTIYSFMLICFFCFSATAQENSFNVYDSNLDGIEQLENAKSIATTENKHILLIIGGNWCKWCRMFDKFSLENAKVDSTLNADYTIVHINYSKENENTSLLEYLDYPQRFGFPVFIVLNKKGIRLHTQNTAYLEEGQGYSEKKVIGFLNDWSPFALKAPE